MIRIRYDGLLGLCQREYGRGLCGIRIMDISERQQIVEHYAERRILWKYCEAEDFCKSKVSVRKVYSGTKDSHDVMSWESFCTITGVVHNGCYSYRLPPKGLKELVLTYEL